MAAMISSVAARRARPDEAAPCRLRSSGAPKRTVTGRTRGSFVPDRLDRLGADEADGHDRRAGLKCEPGDAGATAVEATVERARALGIDGEGGAGLEDAPALVERLLRLRAGSALDADGADRA